MSHIFFDRKESIGNGCIPQLNNINWLTRTWDILSYSRNNVIQNNILLGINDEEEHLKKRLTNDYHCKRIGRGTNRG